MQPVLAICITSHCSHPINVYKLANLILHSRRVLIVRVELLLEHEVLEVLLQHPLDLLLSPLVLLLLLPPLFLLLLLFLPLRILLPAHLVLQVHEGDAAAASAAALHVRGGHFDDEPSNKFLSFLLIVGFCQSVLVCPLSDFPPKIFCWRWDERSSELHFPKFKLFSEMSFFLM